MSSTNHGSDEEYDVQVLCCVPTSLRARGGIRYVAKPEYSTANCESCKAQIWIGPSQVEYKKEHPDARVLCMGCVAEEYGVDAMKNVKQLNDE